MAGEDEPAKGEGASSPPPTHQDDGAPHRGSGEQAHVDEDAILREGVEARRRLGRQVAREALVDPGGLTPERLRRLGPEGLHRFVVELRRSGLGGAQQPRRDGPQAVPASRASQPVTRPRPSPPAVAPGPTGKALPPSPPHRSRAGPPANAVDGNDASRPAPPKVGHPPGSIDATSSKGWWRAGLKPRHAFERNALLAGLGAGSAALGLCLAWLALTRL